MYKYGVLIVLLIFAVIGGIAFYERKHKQASLPTSLIEPPSSPPPHPSPPPPPTKGGVWYVPDSTRKLLMEVFEVRGVAAMLSRAEQLERSSATLTSNCHPLRHMLGRAVYNASLAARPRDRDGALRAATNASWPSLIACNGGFLHGVTESFISPTNVSDDAVRFTHIVCAVHHGDARSAFECAHGLGHGIQRAARGDLLRTLRVCEHAMSAHGADAGNCKNGALMEVFAAAPDAAYARGALASVCGGTLRRERFEQSTCAMYAAIGFLKFAPRQYDATARWCVEEPANKALEYDIVQQCAYGVGMQAIKENADNASFAEHACYSYLPAWPASHYACLRGLFGYVAFGFEGKVVDKTSFCGSFRHVENTKHCDLKVSQL